MGKDKFEKQGLRRQTKGERKRKKHDPNPKSKVIPEDHNDHAQDAFKGCEPPNQTEPHVETKATATSGSDAEASEITDQSSQDMHDSQVGRKIDEPKRKLFHQLYADKESATE
ncbi:hypothetical protein N7520_004569 [Penicillium odoratum]|uniref:uncharacterized protein n=1 Tax=Penicillium odoratum TaxID=1167516 RepID=UPI002548E738|nr:uncharacterized protein N7520_004569 [Penicillium odoratum]KAJ5765010.1 hypothetical protein N7520_004569 [Penicillium odoratum]